MFSVSLGQGGMEEEELIFDLLLTLLVTTGQLHRSQKSILCQLREQPVYSYLLGHNVDIFTRAFLSIFKWSCSFKYGVYLSQSTCIYFGQNESFSDGGHIPHKTSVTQDGSHLGSHRFLQECLWLHHM